MVCWEGVGGRAGDHVSVVRSIWSAPKRDMVTFAVRSVCPKARTDVVLCWYHNPAEVDSIRY